MSDDSATTQVRFRKNGDLSIDEDGTKTVIAHYDRATGRLEFATKADSAKYYNQVTARIGTVANGTQPSGLVIRSIGVMGEAAPPPDAKAPKRPRLGPEGDSAEDVVQWFLDHDLPQAIVRYGIFTDEKGAPVRKPVRRMILNTVDNRNIDDDNIPEVKEGPKTKSKSPVSVQGEVIEKKDGIIARRATRLTFTPSEVVGGFQPDDDFEVAVTAQEDV